MADASQSTTTHYRREPLPNCCTCGRFIGRGATVAMRYSGYPPMPDHEDFRCAPCTARLGPLEDDKP